MKNANRSDNQRAMSRQNRSGYGRRVKRHGQSKQRDGKFLNETPAEHRGRSRALAERVEAEAAKQGLVRISTEAFNRLQTLPEAEDVPIKVTGSSPEVRFFAPASIAEMIKTWEEAIQLRGPAAHIPEFRGLSFETVVKLAVDEWRELQKVK